MADIKTTDHFFHALRSAAFSISCGLLVLISQTQKISHEKKTQVEWFVLNG